MHFTRQFAVFVKAGIPITEALDVIGDETRTSRCGARSAA
jgi:type IV pilus assembly protein PilC